MKTSYSFACMLCTQLYEIFTVYFYCVFLYVWKVLLLLAKIFNFLFYIFHISEKLSIDMKCLIWKPAHQSSSINRNEIAQGSFATRRNTTGSFMQRVCVIEPDGIKPTPSYARKCFAAGHECPFSNYEYVMLLINFAVFVRYFFKISSSF